MKFKLDENLEPGLAALLQQERHDVATVLSQSLSGRPDTEIYGVCGAEGRTLITMDLDFSNPLRFPAANTPGIIILRPPRPVLSLIRSVFSALPALLRRESPIGQLWIVEPGRLRVHEPMKDETKGNPPTTE